MKVNMTPNPLDVVTIHASQGDTEARQWEFELHNNGELIDTSEITEQLFFKAYKGGTEQILPENTSTPTTSPFIGDIKYPQGLLTNQEFTYRQSPTEEDGNAKIKNLYGNTLAWNQLVQNGNFADGTNNWEAGGSSTISASNGELTVTVGGAWNNDARQNRPLVVGHKYLGTFKVKSDTLRNIGVSLGQFGAVTNARFASTETLSSAYQTVVGIATITESTSVIRCSLTANASSYTGQTFTIKDVMLFDLTQMGLDISSPSDFTSLFPLSYYSYNQGSLLSFNGNGIETVGKNLLEIKNNNRTVNGISYTVNDDKSITAKGTATKTSYFIFTNSNNSLSEQNETPFKKGMSLIFSTNTGKRLTYRDRTGTYGYFNLEEVINLSQDIACIYVEYALGEVIDMTIYPMIRFSNVTDSTFEPYTSSTLSLPISTYFPNGMKSAGSVYDELTENKAITRIGAVDLGTLNYINDNSGVYGRFYTTELNSLISKSVDGNLNIMCPRFVAVSTLDVIYNNASGMMFLSIQGNLSFTKNGYTTVQEFKNSLQGVYLYYELATPTETSFTTASLVTENAEIPLSNEDGVLIGKCTEQLSAEPGFHDAKIKLANDDGECYSNKIQLHVERSPQ